LFNPKLPPMHKYYYMWLWLVLLPGFIQAQESVDLDKVEPGRFDQGKMWTFENPPVEYFQEAYNFTPTDEWMEDVRKSALRFATWCSASFISEEGLIMTNHHCSRSVVGSVMNEDENFDENGFYAETRADERRVPDLFVDQLVVLADITDEVKALTGISEDSALAVVEAKYAAKEEWSGLKIENRTFYSGGKYSLYGFKTYEDVRLVLYPELALGFYGGDPDNFTYPRYNLDFTFFRAYDESGEPLTPSNYFTFNPAGAEEDEVVFVIGNPGSTGRYLTMSQLEYQRDTSVPAILSYLQDKMEILMVEADRRTDIYKKDSITNQAFSLSNSNKAYTGRLEGYYDPVLMTKKAKKEEQVRTNVKVEGDDPWTEIEANVAEMSKIYGDLIFLSPGQLGGKVMQILHKLYSYRLALEQEEEEAIEAQKTDIETLLSDFDPQLERALFGSQLAEIKEHSKGGFIDGLLAGADPYDKAKELIDESMLINDAEKFFKQKAGKLDKEPLMAYANEFVPRYQRNGAKYGQLSAQNQEFQKKISNLTFQLSGVTSPPDATFSLRLADGIVKGYEYNGTEAPYKTTYFGLYDRHFSNNKEFPWNLPEKWKNPPLELLKAPLNFVSTADIIGGNSGSPIINQNAEVVGLVFDGNIESLPGYFIYDPAINRTVSVHAGGIAAAVKYIYKAERLLKELNIE